MKKSLFLAVMAFLVPFFLHAQVGKQEVPRFEKVDIAETGAAVYMPRGAGAFEMSLSEDGSEVYTNEIQHGDFFFSVVAVKFVPEMADASAEDLEALLISYLEFLRTQLAVGDAAGVGKGHLKEEVPGARGVIDYWLDAEGTRYAVKGWIDQRMIGVMLLYGPDEYPIYNVQDMFLNGFRFPGE